MEEVMFKKKAEPKVFEAQIKYDPDLQTLSQLRSYILQLNALLMEEKLTEEQYQMEMRLIANTISRLEEKYVEQGV